MNSKEKLDYSYSSLGAMRTLLEDSNQLDAPFEHKSFKNKSTFNPMGPFQLESVFYSIEQDLHRQRYTQPRHRNLSSEEYKAVKSLQHNPDIVIKPADKGSAIVILDKTILHIRRTKTIE